MEGGEESYERFVPQDGTVEPATFRQLLPPMSSFIKIEQLGSGFEGTVFHVYHDENGIRKQEYTLKVLEPKEPPNALERRMEELRQLFQDDQAQHNNIIKHYGTFILNPPHCRGSTCLLMEYFNGKHASELLKYNTSPEKIFDWIEQALTGLDCLHSQGVAHRDIKPDNILHTINDKEKLCVKLVDFGMAKKSPNPESTYTTKIGRMDYWAPEMIPENNQRSYSTKVDIWALGVSIYSCIAGIQYWGAEFSEYIKQNPNFLSRIPFVSLQILLQRMLVSDPTQRFSADQLLQDPIMVAWNRIRNNWDQFFQAEETPTREEQIVLLDMIHPAVPKDNLIQVLGDISYIFAQDPLSIGLFISYGLIEKLLVLLKQAEYTFHRPDEDERFDFYDDFNSILGKEYITEKKDPIMYKGFRDGGMVLLFLDVLLQLEKYRENIIMKIICNDGLPAILARYVINPSVATACLTHLMKHKAASYILVHRHSVERVIYRVLTPLYEKNLLEDLIPNASATLIATLPFKFCPIELFLPFPALSANQTLFSRNSLKNFTSPTVFSPDLGWDREHWFKTQFKVNKLIRIAIARKVCTNKIFQPSTLPLTQYLYFHEDGPLCLSCACTAGCNLNNLPIRLIHGRCSNKGDDGQKYINYITEIFPMEGPNPLFNLPSPLNASAISYSKKDFLYYPKSHKWSSNGQSTRIFQDLGFEFPGQSQSPSQPTNIYFEVKIEQGPDNPHVFPDSFSVSTTDEGGHSYEPVDYAASNIGRIVVGFSTFLNILDMDSNPPKFDGCSTNQLGYHSNGFFFHGDTNPYGSAPRFFAGDVVGCGIYGDLLYFTLNGNLLPFRKQASFPAGTQLYATVSSHNNLSVKFRFQSPFKFDPSVKLFTKQITKSQILRKHCDSATALSMYTNVKRFLPVIFVKVGNSEKKYEVTSYHHLMVEIETLKKTVNLSDDAYFEISGEQYPLNKVIQSQIQIPSFTRLYAQPQTQSVVLQANQQESPKIQDS